MKPITDYFAGNDLFPHHLSRDLVFPFFRLLFLSCSLDIDFILVCVVDLMVRYIYGKPGRYVGVALPKYGQKSKSRQTQNRSRMHVINSS